MNLSVLVTLRCPRHSTGFSHVWLHVKMAPSQSLQPNRTIRTTLGTKSASQCQRWALRGGCEKKQPHLVLHEACSSKVTSKHQSSYVDYALGIATQAQTIFFSFKFTFWLVYSRGTQALATPSINWLSSEVLNGLWTHFRLPDGRLSKAHPRGKKTKNWPMQMLESESRFCKVAMLFHFHLRTPLPLSSIPHQISTRYTLQQRPT